MRIDLRGPKSRFLFFIAVLSLAGFLAFFAGRMWLAEHWGSSSEPHAWERAARLEPGNAWYWEQRGRYEQLDLMSEHPEQAAFYLERAAAVNPRSERVWLELASDYEEGGDVTRATRAYQMAKAAYPISSEVASRYGRFLLRQGEFPSAFVELRRVIEVDPSLAAGAISDCWKTDPNTEDILNDVLPPKADFYDTAINLFIEQQQIDAALAVWKRLLKLKHPLSIAEAIPLVNALIDQNRAADAEEAWRQALHAANWPEGSSRRPSLIFNGGFEDQPAGGGFDWREKKTSGVSYTLDRTVFHSGFQSMRVDFDGSGNLDFSGLQQYVAVNRGQTYYFEAYLRTEGITTDSGISFLIDDPFHSGKIQVSTISMTGDNPWTLVSTEVKASTETDFLTITLKRIPSWKFDNKLRGTVWVDDVSLTPAASAFKGSSK